MIRPHDIRLDLLDLERLCNRFEALARKGWQLTGVGDFFFHFKRREPKELHYYIDSNEVTPEYRETLGSLGYHHIDAWRTMHFYDAEKELPPLDSDPAVLSMTVREFIDPKSIAMSLVCTGMWLVYAWFLGLPVEPYYFYIDTLQVVFRLFLYGIAAILVLDALGDLLIRHAFARTAEGIPIHRKGLSFFLRLTSALAFVMAVFLCILVIWIDHKRPLNLLLDLAAVVLLYAARAVFNHKAGSIDEKGKQYALGFVLFLVLLCGDLMYQGLYRTYPEPQGKTAVSPYGSFVDPQEYVMKTSPFITITEFFAPANGQYEEIIADCRDEKAAEVFFDGLVRNHAAVDVNGYFTLGNDLPVPYQKEEIWSFDQAVEKADSYENSGDMQVLELKDRMYACKGTRVVCVRLPGIDEMEAVRYYLNGF